MLLVTALLEQWNLGSYNGLVM